jgi:hypothetical protein
VGIFDDSNKPTGSPKPVGNLLISLINICHGVGWEDILQRILEKFVLKM